MTELLYEDKTCRIYKELMVINKYYFPLATSKTITWDSVEKLTLIPTEGVEHRWGICGKYLNNWFPLDTERKTKKHFIEVVLKGKKTRPSFTPEDPQKAFKILWERLTPEGQAQKQKEKGPSELSDGNETEMAR